jgi:hypothetical protein
MRKLMRILLIFFVGVLSVISLSSFVSAEPEYNISLEPAKLSKMSEVTFSVSVTGEDIQEVYINVIECEDTQCFVVEKFNESMEKINDGEYTKTITLIQSDANNIEYYLVIRDNGIWYDYIDDFETTYFEVVDNNNGGNSNSDGNGSSDETPGFELLLVFASLIVIFFIFKRKRVL